MVPNIVPLLKRLGQLRVQLVRSSRPLAWLLGVWLLAVGLPAAAAWPDHGLDQMLMWGLIGLGPIGALVAAALSKPWSMLGAGLVGLVPPLVACPALVSADGDQPWSGLLLAVGLLGACNSTLSQATGDLAALPRFIRATHSLRWRWLAAIGCVWLTMAWWGLPGHIPLSDAGRSLRVAGAAACWSLVISIPVRSLTAQREARIWILIARRAAWLSLLGGLLWLWLSRP